MEPVIEFRNVDYRYNDSDQLALHDVSFSLQAGSFTAVLGHNGSGKSTLAKLCNAILLPSAGSVSILGKDSSNADFLPEIRRCVGMVFQNPDNQIVASVVEDDVAFAPENLGIAPDEIRRRVDSSLKKVGMYDFRMHAPHLLSGGQKQRIAIAGILAMHPQILVLDEPTAMLDPQGRHELMDVLYELRKEHVTILLITHHMTECVQADRVIVMSAGKIALDGTPNEVFSKIDDLRRLRLSVPATTETLWLLKKAGITVDSNSLSLDDCAESISSILQ